MGDKRSDRNFPHALRREGNREREGRYNTSAYYGPNRELGQSRDRRPFDVDDHVGYDEYNSGKQEDYKADGYYGSNYGSINELNRGRDVERNSGYRRNYDELTMGQWPEIEEAAERRGVDLRWHELRQRGAYRGKGPRSYQRSDYRIMEDIHDVLYEDPYIDASDVEVKVEKGEVILTGTVENRHIKRRIEDVIEEQVSGIRHLENRIRPRQSTQQFNIRDSNDR